MLQLQLELLYRKSLFQCSVGTNGNLSLYIFSCKQVAFMHDIFKIILTPQSWICIPCRYFSTRSFGNSGVVFPFFLASVETFLHSGICSCIRLKPNSFRSRRIVHHYEYLYRTGLCKSRVFVMSYRTLLLIVLCLGNDIERLYEIIKTIREFRPAIIQNKEKMRFCL